MKYLIIVLIFMAASTIPCFSQQDTSAYQLQRQKVNQLLSERSSKFGQYDQSLSSRTGIFGLKTKRDMQRSINILTEIVRTDNNIFLETKALLDYKDLEKAVAQDKYQHTESSKINFMTTITKLQQQNEHLKAELEKSERRNTRVFYSFLMLIIVLAAAGTYLYRNKKLTFN